MEITIIPYEDRYAADFKRMNLGWLDRYHLTEAPDLEVLNDPRGTVLKDGGVLFLAKAGDEIIGSAGLKKEDEGVFELIKMTVTGSWQGRGIGRMLMDACLQTARERNVKKITLYSNSQLQRAINLYEQYGFRHTTLDNSPLETADVRMELIL